MLHSIYHMTLRLLLGECKAQDFAKCMCQTLL